MGNDDGINNGFVSLYPVFVVLTQRFTLDLIACAGLIHSLSAAH